MSFELDKRNALEKSDKSSIGGIDKPIENLCNLINKSKNYFTTSSCSGRTVISATPDSGKKHDLEWLYVSHDLANSESIIKTVASANAREVWFRYEPLILHIACKNLEVANNLLTKLHEVGFRRAGIISNNKKIIIEISGHERIETPLVEENNVLVSEEFLEMLVEFANRKQKKNWELIEKVESLFTSTS